MPVSLSRGQHVVFPMGQAGKAVIMLAAERRVFYATFAREIRLEEWDIGTVSGHLPHPRAGCSTEKRIW